MNDVLGIPLGQVVVIMAGLSALVSLIAVWQSLLVRHPSVGRIKALTGERRAMRQRMMQLNKREKLVPLTLMQKVVERFNLLRSTQAEQVQLQLARAGWRSKDALIRYFFLRLTLPFIFGAAALVMFADKDTTTRLMYTLGSVFAGAYGPGWFVKNQVQKRYKEIQKSLPDMLDLLVICAEAGLSLDAALNRVATEMGDTSPELTDEITLTAIEISFMPDRTQALTNLRDRVDLPAVRGLVNTLVQAERYGTPLAKALRVLAAEFREERILKAEEKGARLPALLTVPMIIFILPPLFIVLLGSAALDLMDALSVMNY